MSLADRIAIPYRVKHEDLGKIDRPTAKLLVGELHLLRYRSKDECPELTWQWDDLVHRRASIGNYVVVFHLRGNEGGPTVAVIEAVVQESELEGWLEGKAREAEAWRPADPQSGGEDE